MLPNSTRIRSNHAAALVARTGAILLAGCVSNPNALAKKEPRAEDAGADTSSAGGISGRAGGAGAGGDVASGGGGASSIGGVGGGPEEPPGASAVTFLNGLVDADHIALCFAPVAAGVAGTPVGDPMPAGGLPFGDRWSVSSLGGFDFSADDLVPIVIAGTLADIDGLDCAQAVARANAFRDGDAGTDGGGVAGTGSGGASSAGGAGGPGVAGADAGLAGSGAGGAGGAGFTLPRLRSAPLSIIPHGTFGGGRSLLVAITGCMGAPGLVDPVDQIACGRGYSPDTPTLGMIVAAASRIVEPGRVGLQVLNASRATERFDLTATPPTTSSGASVAIARDVWYGELLPYPPLLGATRATLGVDTGYSLTLTQFSTPTLVSSWTDALGRGSTDLQDGKDYTIVLLGAVPTVGNPKWFERPVLTVVPSDP